MRRSKTLLRDAAILGSYVTGWSSLRSAVSRWQGKATTRILAFHQVKEPEMAVFDQMLRYLKEHCHIVGLQDFLADRTFPEQLNVVLTFDDGYQSWLTNVLPFLEKHGLPATFFICSGFVKLTEEAAIEDFCRHRFRVRPVPNLTSDQLRQLRQRGFEVGGHTRSHVDLGQPHSESVLEAEICSDKATLEEILEEKITAFAYPFGEVFNISDRAVKMIQRSGYTCALTINPGRNQATTDRYRLYRDSLDPVRPNLLLRARMAGSYDGLKAATNAMKGYFHP